MFEHRVLRKLFGPKWEKVTGDRRKLHNEELHYQIEEMEIAGMAQMGVKRNAYRILEANLKERTTGIHT
jgi:hypothetical protein